MEWPKELIIKRDITKTYVENKNEIIAYINNCYDINILTNYMSSLKTQTKVEMNKVDEIINATKDRINTINLFMNEYEKNKHDDELLAEFYEKNYKFIEGIIDSYINTKKGEIENGNV